MEKTNLPHIGMKSVMFCKNNIHALFCMGLSFDIFFVALFSHPLPSLVTCLLLLTTLFVRTDLKSKLPMSSNYSVHCSMMASARFFSAILSLSIMSLGHVRPYCYTINPKLSLDYVDVADDDVASEDADDKAEKFELRGVAGIDRSDRRLISRPSPSITNKEDGKLEKEKEWATTWW